MKHDDYPPISEALIVALLRTFPDRVPMEVGITPQAIGVFQGQQEVIRYLRRIQEKQTQ